jgi:hypothetical protein
MKIRLKICIVLKYWIEHQFEDFDRRIIATLNEFINVTLINDNHPDLSKLLDKELKKKVQFKFPISHFHHFLHF